MTSEEALSKKFDIVLALDSYFTRFGTEQSQKDMIAKAHSMTNKALITTIKDFKNMNLWIL